MRIHRHNYELPREVALLESQRFSVIGVKIDCLNTETAIQWVRRRVIEGPKAYVIFCTVSSILTARDDPVVKGSFDDADLVTPDGMPLVWLGRRRSGAPIERVYGPDFMLDLMAETGAELSHFFYGGAEGVADVMAAALCKKFPDLRVAGTLSPPFGFNTSVPAEADVAAINRAEPDIVWVGIGHPRQELWMKTNRPLLDAPVLAGVGAAFDFHSGRVKEAPGWMKKSGLQWLHRLASDPKRLWRRYLVGNARFLWLVFLEGVASGRRRGRTRAKK